MALISTMNIRHDDDFKISVLPNDMKHLVSKEGFLFVNKDFTNGVIIARELFIPDDYNLDLYMELPEQEALELQEKYNIENGNYYNNR